MPSSKNPSREVEEVEEVPSADDESPHDDDDDSGLFDEELIVEEIELDELPEMEGPDA